MVDRNLPPRKTPCEIKLRSCSGGAQLPMNEPGLDYTTQLFLLAIQLTTRRML